MDAPQIKILLIEENDADAYLIDQYLQNSSNLKNELTHKATFEEAYQILKNKVFDIILIDLNLSNKKGLEAFNVIKEEFPNIPLIVLSGVHDEEMAMSAVKQGAQDYIAKTQMNPYILNRAIKYSIERKQMELEIIRTQKLETIGILAGGIAHDFNNILTSILGNISLVKMDLKPSQDPEKYHLLEEAETASLQAQKLANQLLTFSKGGAPVKKKVNLFELIQETAQFALRGSNVRCNIDYDPEIWPVEVDKGQIHQVLNNIIINANQSMKHGGEITISTANEILSSDTQTPLKPGHYVHIAIKDQGVGIPPEHIKKVFDPYFTTKKEGTGLGLTTSYSIIKKHEGYIYVESEINRGSIFHIYLPAAKMNNNISPTSKPDLLADSKPTILVMDDEKGVRSILKKMLEKLGFSVLLTENGQDMISLYKNRKQTKKPVDLLILDLTIPGGMGGEEAFMLLRQEFPEVKAIVASGYSNAPIMANYQDYGFIGVLKKPFTFSNLKDLLTTQFSSL